MPPAPDYTGRFAPSPTGPLHIGSLTSAVASFLDARAHGGRWLVRMEDIDPPREIPGADQQILDSLRQHGLHWDGEVLYQSHRAASYENSLQLLLDRDLAFFCHCTRKQLQPSGGIHHHCVAPRQNAAGAAIRLHVGQEEVCFVDDLQGKYCQQLDRDVGDFVLRRRDGLYAYQLAVVVDDAAQGITHVVRGSDLLDSTPRQIYLQRQLGLPTPHYLHVPVITNSAGQKLSKQTFARALEASRARENLLQALHYLGQPRPSKTAHNSCETLLSWAAENWQRELLPNAAQLTQNQG